MQSRFTLNAGETIEIAFVIGCGADRTEAAALMQRYATIKDAHAAIDGACKPWDDILQSIQVKTPNRALDV